MIRFLSKAMQALPLHHIRDCTNRILILSCSDNLLFCLHNLFSRPHNLLSRSDNFIGLPDWIMQYIGISHSEFLIELCEQDNKLCEQDN